MTVAAVDAVRKALEDDPRGAEPPAETAAIDEVGVLEPAGELVLLANGSCRTVRLPVSVTEPAGQGCEIDASSPRPDGASLISRDAIERAARRHLNAPDPPAELEVDVADVAWLSRTRAVLRLEVETGGRGGRQPLVAFFESGRLVQTASFLHRVGPLRMSPGGGYVALPPGIVLRRDGSQATLPPQLVHAHAVAWSPDGRWLALAQRAVVVLVDVESLERYDRTGGGFRSVTLQLFARDLAWR